MRIGLLLFFALCAPTYAADLGSPRKVADRYNAAARASGIEPRLVLIKCSGSPENACLFSASGKVTVLAVADAKTPNKTQLITFAVDKSSDLGQWVTTMLVAMTAWSPTQDSKEIQAAFRIMIRTPIENYREAQIRDVKYVLKEIAPGAFAFTIKDANL